MRSVSVETGIPRRLQRESSNLAMLRGILDNRVEVVAVTQSAPLWSTLLSEDTENLLI